jgi:UDP-N-acetylmuramoyl-tripeptide--D-alanyl-D-alanine ligase
MTIPHRKSKQELVKIVSGITAPENITAKDSNQFYSGVEFDSRKVKQEQLFCAFKGEKSHGHDYLDSSFTAGASLALIEDKSLLKISNHKEKLIYVPDTIAALNTLAKHIRLETPTPTLGITGSMGKTTVKAMCRSMLMEYGAGTASIASYNNHIGVAYTICNSTPEDKWLVLEMGMNHAGELTALTNVAKPDVAIITSIAPAHMEFFKNLDEVCAAKLEILSGIKQGGTLILNGDDQVLITGFKKWLADNANQADFKVKYYGHSPEFDLFIKNTKSLKLNGFEITYTLDGKDTNIRLPLLGTHNVLNAAAAILGCSTLIANFNANHISEGLLNLTPEKHRLNIIRIDDNKTIIDDSYNASPKAVIEAINLTKELLESDQTLGLILGDMAELGKHSKKFHEEVADAVISATPQFIITIGEYSKIICDKAISAGIDAVHCTSIESAVTAVLARDYNLLLVKGSRSVGLDRIVVELKTG